MKRYLLPVLAITALVFNATEGISQFLSSLQAVRSDALFTTYAAPPERTSYLNDQGYQFRWFDEEAGVEFVSATGPNMGVAFEVNGRLVFKLGALFREPVVTKSYSDLVEYFYYPFKDLLVEVFFTTYSSETAILECRIMNESAFPAEFNACPYLCYPSEDSNDDMISEGGHYSFPLSRKRDGWMIEHRIPLAEKLEGSLSFTNLRSPAGMSFIRQRSDTADAEGTPGHAELINALKRHGSQSPFIKGIIRTRTYSMEPGDQTSFRMIVQIREVGKRRSPAGMRDWSRLDLPSLVKADEKAYARIPKLTFSNRDHEMLYWSAFSLMRQCMMPPEGACRRNYYVFSREPKWGWGYGGQVFHESLAMMAYAYMDPKGAMNAQRIYFDRQRPDGYINYRTGPYLDETIETNGQPTSSAPWFNYENLEIYRVTGDRQFLREAYKSGKKFYQYYVARRDSNQNGLCEWGGHAELESVRDVRVAVWDKIGWPSNFEGPDVNSMLVMEATALGEMAQLLGLPGEAKTCRQEAAARAALINRYMWDEQTGFYYNINRDDQSFTYRRADDLKIREIIGFLPLWAGVTDSLRAARLVERMTDPDDFWRPYGVPTLTAASDYYNPIGYWNGPVWVQWEYLLYRGLRDYGYRKVAGQLAERVLANMVYHLKNDHVFWEFYSADDLQAGWNKTYIWAGIAARFFIDGVKEK